jgi:hypothetical protein
VSLQAFMADLVRATSAADRNRAKLREIEAHLKGLRPPTSLPSSCTLFVVIRPDS